jgi:dihydrodipicolinate synthase/N-acetylneuraminate lyase
MMRWLGSLCFYLRTTRHQRRCARRMADDVAKLPLNFFNEKRMRITIAALTAKGIADAAEIDGLKNALQDERRATQAAKDAGQRAVDAVNQKLEARGRDVDALKGDHENG